MDQPIPQSPNLPAPQSPKQPLIAIDTLFDTAWEKFKTNYKKIVTIVIIMLIPNFLIQLLNWLATGEFGSRATFGAQSALMTIIMILLVLLSIIASLWGMLALINIITNDFSLTVEDSFRRGAGKILSYVWIGILTGVLSFLGFILFILPGIYLAISFSFVFLILVTEDLRGYAALKRSKNLVKNYWWAVFGRYILLGLVFILLYILSSILFIIPGAGPVLGTLYTIILSIIFTPLSLIFSYLIFTDLKRIKG